MKLSLRANAETVARIARAGGTLFVLLALGFAVTSCNAGQKPKTNSAADTGLGLATHLPADRAIDLEISQMLGAWQIGDVQRMHQYYADDVIVVSGNWQPPLIGWTKYLEAYQAQRARTQGTRLDRSNTFIVVRGQTAWAVYQWEFHGIVDGQEAAARGQTTLIFEQRNARWLIVLNHTSVAPGTSQEKPAVPAGAAQPASPPAERNSGEIPLS